VKVNGIWAQDWSGIRMTSFGKRVMWNWKWNSELPQLDAYCTMERKACSSSPISTRTSPAIKISAKRAKRGYLTKNADGKDYHVEFGEFYAGVIDLTNPAAYDWYKEVIKKNLIELGCGGWMADFGDLPTDTFLHNGVSAEIMHNAWPALWAKCNYEGAGDRQARRDPVLHARGLHRQPEALGDDVGGRSERRLEPGRRSGVRHPCGAVAGDDRARPAPQRHRRLYHPVRDEAQQRAAAALVRLQRLYADDAYPEGRPGDNWQFDGDAETIAHFARMTTVSPP
jgi:alpha-glucosidase